MPPFFLLACPSVGQEPSSLARSLKRKFRNSASRKKSLREWGEGTKLDACVLFNSTFWQKRKPQVGLYRVFDT